MIESRGLFVPALHWAFVVCALGALAFGSVSLAAAPDKIYTDKQLFKIGKDKFDSDEMYEAAAYLFAYMQRDPKRMKNDPGHREDVIDAYNWAVGYSQDAGVTGDGRDKPVFGQKQGRKTTKVITATNRRGEPGLDEFLRSKQWSSARDETWKIMIREGDLNRDGYLNYAENNQFPCNDLQELAEKWKSSYGSSSGYDDILIPRFRNRFVTCGIWSR